MPLTSLPPLVALTANVLKNKKEYLDAGMDDVLSKPLSVPALTAMIKKFWDAPDEEAQEAPAADLHKADAVLDTDMLEQYIELVGPKLINDGLAVFEKMMPGYMSVLESNLTARDQKGLSKRGIRSKGRPVLSDCATSSSWASRSRLRICLPGLIMSLNGLKR